MQGQEVFQTTQELALPKGELTGLLTLDRNDVLFEKDNFINTDSQLPIDPNPRASLIALRL